MVRFIYNPVASEEVSGTLNRRLGRPQNRPGRYSKEKNLVTVKGFKPRLSRVA